MKKISRHKGMIALRAITLLSGSTATAIGILFCNSIVSILVVALVGAMITVTIDDAVESLDQKVQDKMHIDDMCNDYYQ